MATGMAVADINSSLDTIFTGTQWIKLHIGDPGAAGTANPAVNTTRQSLTWAAAAAGSKASASTLSWTSVSTTETYTHFSVWSASTSGTFHGSGTVTSGAVTAGQDATIATAAITVSASGAA